MSQWPKHPSIYEINTWVWLGELSAREGRVLTLANVPDQAWDEVASLGFDAVWLMGVWERSPAGIAIANHNDSLLADFRRALPDYRSEDNAGSPYCVRRYVVDGHLGGRKGLQATRTALAKRGMKLVLDFVPNHVAPDHPLVKQRPTFFIRGTASDLERDPMSYMSVGNHVFACGRDPYFPAWRDVLQVNAFSPALRSAAIRTLHDIAAQCDGVRCDMAMLMLNDVFARTWGARAGPRPSGDYWNDVIGALRAEQPDFLFIAEAYWDLEWELQRQGFDFCYDKRLYDRFGHDNAESVSSHLRAEHAYQDKLLRFIENHDEPRAAAAFSGERARTAALVSLTQTGARLVHEGQVEGRKVRLPVFLARRPHETPDESLRDFYRTLLAATASPLFKLGEWALCERTGWPDNPSFRHIVAWCWHHGGERCLIVVNLGDYPSQAHVQVPWADLAGHNWRLSDMFSDAIFERNGNGMVQPGLYVDLPPSAFHFLRLDPAHATT